MLISMRDGMMRGLFQSYCLNSTKFGAWLQAEKWSKGIFFKLSETFGKFGASLNSKSNIKKFKIT